MTSENIQVYIVGAGPGDPALLTLKAFRLISEWAEMVVYDRLIPDEILDLIPSHVERIYAGKSCKKHHMTQDEINEELVKQAKLGKKTVRLKGGDPFIFGRGGEEIQHLAGNGISFEVVPGISAASGIMSKLGVPMTHRGIANSVSFITGHQQKGESQEPDWKGLAREDNTIIIYMGLTNLDYITSKLIESGLSEKTPAMAIQEGLMKGEKIIKSDLQNIAAQADAENLKPPTIIIIGKVAAL